MPESVESLLHPRIVTNCLPRYRDGYYKDAVAEAMTQVERSIKERAGVTDLLTGFLRCLLGPPEGV